MPVKTIPALLKFKTRQVGNRTYLEVKVSGYRLMYVTGTSRTRNLPLDSDAGSTAALRRISYAMVRESARIRNPKVASETAYCTLSLEVTARGDVQDVKQAILDAFQAANVPVELAA